ncbi:MAG: 2-oxoglutarate dehydrogenase, E2 component, dihydrolipoamide succinyltransferase [Ignavibacteriaceae bacterium]|nr:2-oxoglutarate dehydrogenase, E2 component, dihydrolipoamide succinyltransferase [Ignavibacteriaceae bacterium]
MDIVMPKMGESVNEGTIIKWHKKVGDQVKRDEIIFEISTDKVDTEIPSPDEGVLSEILIQEGETVEVGTVVAKISGVGESIVKTEEAVENKTEVKEKNIADEKKHETSREAEATTQTTGNLIDIVMPKMGESVMEGTIIKWYKKIGDKVKKDETIFEISTDKVDTEIPSPEEGIVAEILVGEQETVEVGTVVVRLSVGAGVMVSKSSEQKVDEVQVQEKVLEVESMHDNFGKNINVRPKEQGSGSGFFSPLVLSIAQKENVNSEELKSISGSGLEGRVTKKDILNYLELRKSGKVAKQTTSNGRVSSTTYFSGEVEKIPMDNIRQKIMQHMILSRDTSVHVTEMTEVDMTRIHNFIESNKNVILKKENVKLTYLAFVADACVKSLKKYPIVNSSIEGNTIIQKKIINLGIAVALEPDGLIVPNIKDAGGRNITGIARSISDIAYRARNKKLTPDDISNGSFSITNYGVFGTIFGTPIINQPEVAILGVGAVIKKPVVIEVDGTDTIAIRNIMTLTVAHDHRLVDGMIGGMFLKEIKDILEKFEPHFFN